MYHKESLINLYNKYYRNSVVLQRFAKVFSLDVLVRASNLLLLPVYLRLMSKDEFGLYTYIYSIISLLSLVLNFGFYLSQTKLYHDFNNEQRKSLLFTINVTLICLITITLAPVYLFGYDQVIIDLLFKKPIDYGQYRSFILIGILVAVYSFMLTNFFVTSENIRKLQWFNFLKLTLVHSIVLSLLYFTSEDNVAVRLKYSFLIELSIVIFFGIFYIKNMRPVYDLYFAKKTFKIGFPSMLSSIMGLIYNFSDKFILEKYGTFSDLAVYNLGFTLSGTILIVFMSFQTVFLPFFYKEKDIAKNFAKTKAILSKMVLIFIGLSIAIFAGVYVFIQWNIIPREKYEAVLLILPILLITQIFQAMLHLFGNYLVYFEVVYVGTVMIMFLSALNIGLNILLIPAYGIMGASASTLIISVLSVGVYYLYISRKCKIKAGLV